MSVRSTTSQRGVSLSGVIVILIVLALLAIVGMKVVPTVTEYFSIKRVITSIKDSAKTPQEMRDSFNKQASIAYIETISGKDLEISPNSRGGFDISFAYPKKIGLVGPVSLLIEYEGSTDPNAAKKQPAAKE